MNNYSKLNHTTWDCKCHLIWIPKYRKKLIYGNLRKYLGEILRELALQKESNIIEGRTDAQYLARIILTRCFISIDLFRYYSLIEINLIL